MEINKNSAEQNREELIEKIVGNQNSDLQKEDADFNEEPKKMKPFSDLQKAGFIVNVDPNEAAKAPHLFLDPNSDYARVYGLAGAMARVRFQQNNKYYDDNGKLVEVTTPI